MDFHLVIGRYSVLNTIKLSWEEENITLSSFNYRRFFSDHFHNTSTWSHHACPNFVSYDRCIFSIEQQLSSRGAMVFGTIISSPRASLSLHQVLRLANVYLENARQETDATIALVLCHDAEVSLSQVKRAAKHTKDKDMREGIASIYNGLGDLLDNQGCGSEAQAFYNKSAKWR